MRKRIFMAGLLAGTVLATSVLAETPWDGPTEGPAAAQGKSIAVLAGDLKNGGILGVTSGIEEAAGVIGWQVRVLDGAGSIQGRTAAIGQALALQPDGIIINGFDAVEQQAALEGVAAAGIPMVAWHSGPKIGCDAPGGIFANVSTDAMTVSEVAAEWAIKDGGDGMGAIIFTDSTYQIAIDKADRIKETIEAMGGTVLEYVDTPIADTSTRMGPLTISLLQKYGDSWTHALAINDLYFDFMGPALASSGISTEVGPKAGSAGDGSEAAFQRIRTENYQTITVAEPLNLQGWQLVDEMNRAIQGEACSGYVTSPALVTQEGLAKISGNQFDPDTPYRAAYAAIWGK
ncbi:Ribose ABC transporter, periplasmic ribose-binding protein [Candidatus Rhodobacter oscarellae]|uniref:Ribose ABC transporter, periplasmic ribose-binding protein n=1 Tax=Candidatus Rhodobacter oscarellae TaxID=1675527 RepID=A0A0J9EEY5_9RHOB|nr:substrate-binding domain-containing protein [Candidatus Rhodobacter lobularis]KMW60244.1 Ribose ABC transporter, periplasmic ribose-binding protein [Candidatus Rhodobacter lobularis]